MSGTYISVALQATTTEQIQTSADALSWALRASGADNGGGYCIASGGSTVVAIVLDSSGFTSIAIRSTDAGATWSTNSVPQHFQYVAVATDGAGTWVGMDVLGHMIVSTDDGVTWADAATLASNDGGWQALAFGAGVFVAVGADDASGAVVATSPDGSTWTGGTAPIKLWQGICFGGGQFVAVGGDSPLFSGLPGLACVMTSPDGFTWTSQTPAGSSSRGWRAVAFGPSGYVAVSQDGAGSVMVSADGFTWSIQSASNATACLGVCYGGGLYVISRFDNTASFQTIVTSPDTITWTSQTAAIPDFLTATVFLDPCASLSVSCGSPPSGTVGTPYTHTFPHSGGAAVFFSIVSGSLPPGLSLDPATGLVSGTPTTAGPYSFTVQVAYAYIMATGDDGSFSDSEIVITSADGSTWAQQTTAITDSGWSVIYSAALGLWINGTDFAGTTEQIQTSPSGTSGDWTAQSSPADNTGWVKKMVSGKDKIVALYQISSVMHIMTSADGVTWTSRSSAGATIDSAADVAYSPDLDLYCIAEVTFGTPGVLTSPDGITWTFRNVGTALPAAAIAWGAGLFVVVGGPQGSGVHLMTSPDGINWTIQSNPGGSAQNWSGIAYANGTFVIVSVDTSTNPGNQAATSTDGINWTIHATPGSGKHWTCVSYGYGQWISGAANSANTQPLMISTDNGVTWSLVPALGFSFGFINGIAFGPNGTCTATANCSITIGGGSTMGNVWSGQSQGIGNHW